MGIDIETKVSLMDIRSSFRFYLLKSTDIVKSKTYIVEVATAEKAGNLILAMENIGISNLKARQGALAFALPLNQDIGDALRISEKPTAIKAVMHQNWLILV